jgi:hypothetical protein
MIKTIAMDHDVWEYYDPDSTINALYPSNLLGNATAIQERIHSSRMINYERIRKGLARVNSTI